MSHLTEEEVRNLPKGLSLKTRARTLTIKTRHFNRSRTGKDYGAFIVLDSNGEQLGLAWLCIYHKERIDDGKRIAGRSAVLYDIQIHQKEDRHQGIGTAWVEFMVKYSNARGSERFYAANVLESENKLFFAKVGFVPTDNYLDWWILKEF